MAVRGLLVLCSPVWLNHNGDLTSFFIRSEWLGFGASTTGSFYGKWSAVSWSLYSIFCFLLVCGGSPLGRWLDGAFWFCPTVGKLLLSFFHCLSLVFVLCLCSRPVKLSCLAPCLVASSISESSSFVCLELGWLADFSCFLGSPNNLAIHAISQVKVKQIRWHVHASPAMSHLLAMLLDDWVLLLTWFASSEAVALLSGQHCLPPLARVAPLLLRFGLTLKGLPLRFLVSL
ncbi:unnamed protein product [Arabidopsis halleri]